MKKMWLVGAVFLAAILGCDENSSGPDPVAYPLKFTVDAAPGGVKPDSLFIRLKITGDSEQTLFYNWENGKSRGSVSAKDGGAFKIHYEVFVCDYRVGMGEDSGSFAKNQDLALHVKWDTAALAKAKLCRMGGCVPPELKSGFDLALAGKTFEFPASCDSGATYRWSVIRGDTVLLSGQGSNHSFIMPDSLKGSDVQVKFQILVAGHVTDERVFGVKVLAHVSEGRLVRKLIKNDPAADQGSSVAFSYDSAGRAFLVETYDTLTPKNDGKPLVVDSIFYDAENRVKRSVAHFSGGDSLDSAFSYTTDGYLASIKVKDGASEVYDSLAYLGKSLSKSMRYVSGTLREFTVYRNLQDTVWDSVYSVDAGKPSLARVIQRLFHLDSLIERRVWVAGNGLQPLTKEVVVYNGIFKRGYRQVFSVGQTLNLEETDTYRYDAFGRLSTEQRFDEGTQSFLEADSCLYLGTPAAAKRSAVSQVSRPGLDVLERLSFDASDWRLVLPARIYR